MVKTHLTYSIKDKQWLNYLNKKNLKIDLNKILFNIFNILNVKFTKNHIIDINFIFTNDKEIQKINNAFRNKNNATNILSFPNYEKEFFSLLKSENYFMLGDIVISVDTLLKEILELEISFLDHFDHLIIHSILHLLGFDHINDNKAEEMEDLEQKILFSIKN